jgi:uncharacterized Zn finger protein
VTAQAQPRAIFQRAIERGNLVVAEATLRTEISRPTLVDLLDLTALIAFKQPDRYTRVAARWLQRYLEGVEDATIYDAVFVAACLESLGGRYHERALAALRHVAEEATSRAPRHRTR